jgi:hypothetical protein
MAGKTDARIMLAIWGEGPVAGRSGEDAGGLTRVDRRWSGG